MLDTHIHTTHSHDGAINLEELVIKARDSGLVYLGITEHLDLDVWHTDMRDSLRQLDVESYYKDFERVKHLAGDMILAFGLECGYSKKAEVDYQKILSKYPFDMILNSIHLVDDIDLYLMDKSEIKSKNDIYTKYLNAVLESLHAQYDYHIVAHLGYVMRYVDFANKSIMTDELAVLVDKILLTIIEKDKCLELNTSVKGLSINSLPEYDVIKRYYDLGGRNISYGSDAHTLNRFMAGYDTVSQKAKAIGFKYWTAYKNGKPLKFPI